MNIKLDRAREGSFVIFLTAEIVIAVFFSMALFISGLPAPVLVAGYFLFIVRFMIRIREFWRNMNNIEQAVDSSQEPPRRWK